MWGVGAAVGPVAGYLVDRWSPRLVVAAGLGAAALGLSGAMLAPSLPLFILALGLGGGTGFGLTGMAPQAAVIADAFVRRRGVATGIAFSGSMAGYVLSSPAQWAIAALGWRATFAGYLAMVLVLIPLVLRVYPARLGGARGRGGAAPAAPQRLAGILRGLPFWALAFMFVNAPLVGYLATLQHALYFDRLGFPAAEAAAMLAVGGVLATAGRALVGLAADRAGAPAASLATLVLSLVGTLCLAGLEVWPSRVLAYAYVVLLFLPLGTRAVVVPLLMPRFVPPARFGTVFGWMVLGNSAGAALGPLLSGALYDLTGSYAWLYLTAAVLLALSLLALVVFLVRTARDGP
jgi:MFS family permease